jgi:hypothetical protein
MSSPFINYKSVNPKLEILLDRFDSIQEEYLNNRDKLEFKDFTKQQDKHIAEVGKGYPIGVNSYFTANIKQKENMGWHMGAILYGEISYDRNSRFLPILTETLKEIGGLSVCGINILDPGIQLNWHHDDDYHMTHPTLRTLWGIDVPIEEGRNSIMQMKNSLTGDVETRDFKNKEVFGFWPKTLHRVENNLTQPRTVLAIDVFANK